MSDENKENEQDFQWYYSGKGGMFIIRIIFFLIFFYRLFYSIPTPTEIYRQFT